MCVLCSYDLFIVVFLFVLFVVLGSIMFKPSNVFCVCVVILFYLCVLLFLLLFCFYFLLLCVLFIRYCIVMFMFVYFV